MTPHPPPAWINTYQDTYGLSSDPSLLDRDFIHEFLCHQSHWARGIPRSTVDKAIDHSLCFGIYRLEATHNEHHTQVAFARAITDYATFAYFSDVIILEEHRGFGLARWLIEQMLTHPQLQGLRKYALYSSRARDIYSRFGFQPVADPEHWLEIHHPDIYQESP